MAKQVRSRSGRPPQRRRPKQRRRQQLRLPKLPDLSSLFAPAEFREDAEGSGFFKVIRFTQLQRLQLLRWALYIGMCLLCLVVQDVIMSRISIFGTTTDLAAGIILLITVLEGTDVGSTFVLIASMIYYWSGSAPGPYSVGLLTVLGVIATGVRQLIWHRSLGSIILCAGTALAVYEISLYGVGLFLGLTRWDRILAFLFTAVLTILVMYPEYKLLYKIGQIGGYVWKE